jgi:hypothetical protein
LGLSARLEPLASNCQDRASSRIDWRPNIMSRPTRVAMIDVIGSTVSGPK